MMRGRDLSPSRLPAGRSEGGFSLTEILVVVVILGVTAVVSIPNFTRMRVIYNDSAVLREIAGVHERARLEALKRHSQVGVTYATATHMVTIFEDRNRNDDSSAGNNNGQLDSGEEVVGRAQVESYLRFVHPTSTDLGDIVHLGGNTALYRTDGSLSPPALPTADIPAVYFGDVKLNFFRIRINRVTGGSTIEKWMGDDTWSKDRREWQWQY